MSTVFLDGNMFLSHHPRARLSSSERQQGSKGLLPISIVIVRKTTFQVPLLTTSLPLSLSLAYTRTHITKPSTLSLKPGFLEDRQGRGQCAKKSFRRSVADTDVSRSGNATVLVVEEHEKRESTEVVGAPIVSDDGAESAERLLLCLWSRSRQRLLRTTRTRTRTRARTGKVVELFIMLVMTVVFIAHRDRNDGS